MKNKLVILIIVLFAFLLRAYNLQKVPVSLSWDEAAIGYNAYSILKTGRDEYGTRFPILFRSFNDYKLPGYIYLTVISEKLFGFTQTGVRLPSAVLGTLTVLAFYILISEFQIFGYGLTAFGTLLFAMSPWHLQFSRGAYEANGSLFFFVLGIALLLKGRKRGIAIIIAMMSFAVSLYFYYSARLLVPMMVPVIWYIYRKEYKHFGKFWVGGLICFGLILLPILPRLFGESTTRIGQVSIFTAPATTIEYTIAGARHPEALWAKVFYNRRIGYVYSFIENYLKNNSPDFLFVRGDTYPRHDIAGMGYLYIWELPFFLVGVYMLFKKLTQDKKVILWWYLVGAVPASFTTGSPHGLRTLTSLPVFIVITCLGVGAVYSMMKRHKALLKIVFGFTVGLFFAVYFTYYYDFTPSLVSGDWGDGHKQLFTDLRTRQEAYDQILISGEYFKPYIYALTYLPVDPDVYQKEGTQERVEKFIFFPADWEQKGKSLGAFNPSELAGNKKTLFVFTKKDKKEDLKTMHTITDTYDNPIFYLQELP